MSTQISFTTEPLLKKQAQEKAKKEGIALKTILVYSMKAYVEGKIQFGVLTQEEQVVEEISFNDPQIMEKAVKIAKLLK